MKILTAITASALIGAASLAFAATPAEACPGGKGGKGHARLMTMDADNDGKLTRDELTRGMTEKAGERMARVDTNKDGAIDAGEREAAKAAWMEKKKDRGGKERHHGKGKGDRFAEVDVNADGRLDAGELRAATEAKVAKMIERFDANGDGVLDQAELPQRGKHKKQS